MSSMFLSPDELTELTGFKQTKGHLRWLDQYRWAYALSRNLQPRVAREYYQQRMGLRRSGPSETEQARHAAALEEPDFSALDRV
ncbi:MAG TPA: DUF4224 domain-containing protein [Ideonella sp.]|uniref:DUF4224 domain-containing protein n=1 Tax=Ideonella sp. TaxID=1929293 RepID=UPI002E2F1D6E|nr:DUF4224 domain-containing protein [Ideonella sp.]HEX5684858.1 DUF4224 domain-containing protein [Ideonella sp.]